jgi:hypothetical protein
MVMVVAAKQLGRFHHWMASLKLSFFLWMSTYALIYREFKSELFDFREPSTFHMYRRRLMRLLFWLSGLP